MHITLMVWYLQLCISSAHFLINPYEFWVTGFVSGSQVSGNVEKLDRLQQILTEHELLVDSTEQSRERSKDNEE